MDQESSAAALRTQAGFEPGEPARRAIVRFAALITLAAGIQSCNEVLPPYKDPREVFEGRLWGEYAISRTDNSLKVYMTMVNTFDETFQARAILRGRIVITWQRDPAHTRTATLDSTNLLTGNYNPTTGILTIDPGDSIRLGYSWGFETDAGDTVTRYFRYQRDPTCPARWLSDPESMVVTGELKVFDKVDATTAPPGYVTFIHHKRFVDSRECGSQSMGLSPPLPRP